MTCGGGDEVAGGGAHCVWLRRFHKKDTGRETKGREGQFQLAKGGAHRETDLAVALLGFASSPRTEKPSRAQNGSRHPEIGEQQSRTLNHVAACTMPS